MNLFYRLFITPVEQAMEWIMAGFYGLTGSHGLSIFLLSLTINFVLLPLFQVAERWQEAERRMQQILKPKLKEYREAFRGEERHAMIQALYRQVGYHPIYAMRSSVGLLLQLPFWIAGYQFLSHYQPLNGASFLFLDDLGKPDRLVSDVHVLPFVMTALNVAAAFFYTRRLSIGGQIQPLVLAALFLLLLYSAPSGLLLYWTFNSLFSFFRIALLNSTEAKNPRATAAVNHASANLSVPAVSLDMNKGGLREVIESTKNFASERVTNSQDQMTTCSYGLPLLLDAVLFLAGAAVHTVVNSDWVLLLGYKSHPATISAIVVSIVLLGYVCWARVRHVETTDLRQQCQVGLVWLLFTTLILVDGAWLTQAYPNLHPAKTLGAIFLVLFLMLFASPISNAIPTVRNMTRGHWLFAVSTGLTAFVLFVANPIGLYVSSSEDFVGGVYGVAGTFLVIFVTAWLAMAGLYLLLDKPARNGVTLMSVFTAVSVMAYSSVELKRAGLMTHFILHVPSGLVLAGHEVIVEIVALLLLLALTSYVTIKHWQKVTYVVGAMLFTAIVVTAVEMRGAEGDDTVASTAFPPDHAEIVGFSHDRNVLIILLDGFPGGLLKEIIDEEPEIFQEYQGFTWYPNTLSAGFETMTSIAAVTGGPKYRIHEINSRHYDSVGSAIHEAYGVYVDAFAPRGYEVTYVNPAFIRNCEDLDKRIHCITNTIPYGIYYHGKEEPDAPLLQEDSHVPILLTMVSLMKASPFFMKAWIYDNENYLGANGLQQKQAMLNTTKMMEGWGFLHVLARESNADRKSKTFKFIQLNLPHGPNAINHDCKSRPETATIRTESVCALREVGVLLAWMRQAGIYDISKIVLVSDHGWHVDNPMFPPNFEKVFPKLGGFFADVPGHIQPLLLVKDFGAKGEFLRSDLFLSNADVPSIVCVAVGGCNDVGPDPIANPQESRRLHFAYAAWPPGYINKQKQYDIKVHFEVMDSIFVPENWTRIK